MRASSPEGGSFMRYKGENVLLLKRTDFIVRRTKAPPLGELAMPEGID